MGPQRALLPDGRHHLQHGPIDLVIGAEGDAGPLADAHAAAWARFSTVLIELVAELPALRRPVGERHDLQGPVAQRMWQACHPYRAGFITPMAAVAGAVAQEIVACYARPGIRRAWVNNGGDIALHLAPGHAVRVGLWSDLARLQPGDGPLRTDGQFTVDATMPVRGIATSGWRGRSFSLGIADSVTVLAADAAMADAAATVIANAVNVDDPRIARAPADTLKDDTDLGARLVTVQVPPLGEERLREALHCGLLKARELRAHGLIRRAALVCQGLLARLDEDAPDAPDLTFTNLTRTDIGAVIA